MGATLEYFSDAGFQGRRDTLRNEGERYSRLDDDELGEPGPARLSSLRLSVDPGDTAWYDAFLFSESAFSGDFRHYSAVDGEPAESPFIGHDFNDRTSSIVLVRRNGIEIVLNFASLLDVPGVDLHSGFPDGIRALLRGAPYAFWVPGYDSQVMLLEIHQPGHISCDYDAWIYDFDIELDFEVAFDVYLYVGKGGHLKSYVVGVQVNVENDLGHDDAAEELWRALSSSQGTNVVSTLASQVAESLSVLGGVKGLDDVYLLPGNSTVQPRTGNALADATLVFVIAET